MLARHTGAERRFGSALLVAMAGCNPERLTAPPPALVAPTLVAPTLAARAPAPRASNAAPREAPSPKPQRAQPRAQPAPQPVVPPEKLPVFEPAWLKALGPAGAQKLEVAASVCSAALKHEGKKLLVGCRACPPFDASTGPDGHVALDPEGDFYELEAVYPGSFTRPSAREAVAVFNGCEPHAANFGGSLLVEWAQRAWVSRSYREGFHPAECQRFTRPDARDILVCRWVTDHQGHAHHFLDTYDFALASEQDPDAGWGRVLELDDDSFAACFDPERSNAITADEILRFRVEPPRQGGKARVLVDARFSRAKPSPAFKAKCEELFRSEENGERVNIHGTFKRTERRLVFEWTGEHFEPDSSTKTRLRDLGLLDTAQPADSP